VNQLRCRKFSNSDAIYQAYDREAQVACLLFRGPLKEALSGHGVKLSAS
jgi:hypothetical protein